jgi:hypothetical protein
VVAAGVDGQADGNCHGYHHDGNDPCVSPAPLLRLLELGHARLLPGTLAGSFL